MSGYAHRPYCDCEECWKTVYVSPPCRFIAVDPASPGGDYAVTAEVVRFPDGQIRTMRMTSVSMVQPPLRDDWKPRDLMGPRR